MSSTQRLTSLPAQTSAVPLAPWVPDNGDGTYRNPVLFSDYSDPDVVRVGDDYWLTASSFSHVPGLPILHSRDLVNWTLVNHALRRLVPEEHFRAPRHGGGVWAPAIRHHAGRFWIYYPDPDFGIYAVSTTDPRGEWSSPVPVRAGKGLIDPCPFWDEDGQSYLVHGWAKSRCGICNRITLHRLAPDGLSCLDEGEVIVDADKIGWQTLEGPKLYRRGEYYYIFAPAGGVTNGFQAVFRSRNIRGPYEERIVLAQGRTPINGPHQGAWIDTPGGEHWFVHFQDLNAFGRVVHLQPMTWQEDGWPTMGSPGHEGVGEPVLRHRKPSVRPQRVTAPATTDDFTGPALGRQWQWQGNPMPDWAAMRPPGGLRLKLLPATVGASLWNAPHLLLQKFPAPQFEVATKVTLGSPALGDTAGLVVFGYNYAWLGVRQANDGLRLVMAVCTAANDGGAEVETMNLPAGVGGLTLRVVVGRDAGCMFSYRADGSTFSPVGESFQATCSKWVGAKVGLFARSAAGDATNRYAEFESFDVTAS